MRMPLHYFQYIRVRHPSNTNHCNEHIVRRCVCVYMDHARATLRENEKGARCVNRRIPTWNDLMNACVTT